MNRVLCAALGMINGLRGRGAALASAFALLSLLMAARASADTASLPASLSTPNAHVYLQLTGTRQGVIKGWIPGDPVSTWSSVNATAVGAAASTAFSGRAFSARPADGAPGAVSLKVTVAPVAVPNLFAALTTNETVNAKVRAW